MSGGKNRLLGVLRALPAALVLLTGAAVIAAERDEELAHRLEAVVHVHAEVPPEARTAAYLGTARDGSGVAAACAAAIGAAPEMDGPALALAALSHYALHVTGWTDDREISRREGVDLARRAVRAAGDDAGTLGTAAYVLGYSARTSMPPSH